jgi:predicted RNase H-like HicB family nuclease
MRYLVVVEEGPTSFGAHVPDLPGCVAVAETRNEVLALIKEAIEFHIQGLRDEGIEIPNPHVSSEFVDVKLPDPALVRDGSNRAGCRSFIR